MAPLSDLEILITAQEGYRAFERVVLGARNRIDMGFRVFDPRTKLLTDEARRIGDTWADLLVAKLDEGVAISVKITDFDAVVRAEMHRASWKSYSILAGVAELSRNPGKLTVSVEEHPARVGWAPRIALWPKVQGQIAATCEQLQALDPGARRHALRCMPQLYELIEERDGRVVPKRNRFPQMIPVTHHQKLATVDDEWLYIGGLDLDQRRMDTPAHRGPGEMTWHDVQLLLRDPRLALSAREHLDRFPAECAGSVPVRPPEGLLRTLSVRRAQNRLALSPVVADTGLQDRHLALIDRAERFIYLENQFLRDPVITQALVNRAKAAPELALLGVLPGAPLEVAYEGEDGLDQRYGEYLQARCLGALTDAFGERIFIASPAQCTDAEKDERSVIFGAPMIFVHSKVSVFDGEAALVSSANLNGRSLRWDTEIGVELTDAGQVAALQWRAMEAWLPDDAGPEMLAPEPETVALWRALATENAATSPPARRGFILPHSIRAARRFGRMLPGIPVEMV